MEGIRYLDGRKTFILLSERCCPQCDGDAVAYKGKTRILHANWCPFLESLVRYENRRAVIMSRGPECLMTA